MSAWSGIRPLATDPNIKGTDTASISRDHVICVDSDGLVTVTGGKWTTYRRYEYFSILICHADIT